MYIKHSSTVILSGSNFKLRTLKDRGNQDVHADQETEMDLDRTYIKDMRPSKERPWIGTRKGKGGEGDLDIRGEELSTMRH